jgi:hypothetical protein
MVKVSEQKIAKQIATLIQENVSRITHNDQKYKEQYDNVLSELEAEIEEIESVRQDFTEAKLSVNLIELEGYFRALKTIVKRFSDWEDS